MGPQAIIADAGHGFHGSRRGPGLDLGRGHLREHGVALLLGIGRLLSGSDGRGKLARSQLGLNACIRLIAPDAETIDPTRPSPAKSINTCLNPPLTVPVRDNIFGSIDRTGPL